MCVKPPEQVTGQIRSVTVRSGTSSPCTLTPELNTLDCKILTPYQQPPNPNLWTLNLSP